MGMHISSYRFIGENESKIINNEIYFELVYHIYFVVSSLPAVTFLLTAWFGLNISMDN